MSQLAQNFFWHMKKVPDASLTEDQSAGCIRLNGGCIMRLDLDGGAPPSGLSSRKGQKWKTAPKLKRRLFCLLFDPLSKVVSR